MLEIACNGMVWIVEGPYMSVVAVGYPISHKFGFTDLLDVKFTIPAFEMCAFVRQIRKHLFSDGIRPFAVSLLGCECVVVRHTPWYSW
jgi:hypothetical protein